MQNSNLEVQSLQRALDIIEVIGNRAKPVYFKTIIEATKLPKSTVYRLISNLEHRGYVTCNNDGTYQLGLKLLMMSQRVDQNFELKHLVKPYLEELNDQFKETVHLGILENNKVVYVDSVESPMSVRLVAKIGSTNAVHCTALGKALLIKYSDQNIRTMLQEAGMEKRTNKTIATPDDFIAEMEKVRRQGYGLDDMESENAGRCVSAPIYNYKETVVAAISISGISSRFSLKTVEKDVVPVLLKTTLEISKTLGYAASKLA